ncbi:MAG: MBL fold metallo-hydrolase [Rhodospirillales bacterium]|nr:MBL fold metallo-hydrolase [Rhodospirillales bacterium]
MIFRQLFDRESSTYTYLLAGKHGGEALLIDPVLERVDHYLRLLKEYNLRLIKAVDTHLHADHITALGKLRDETKCITVMGDHSSVDTVSMRISDGDEISIEGVSLKAIYTPGHTDDSYCFLMADRVFTGDTLLIRGTGRTDFQNGNARDQYDSLFGKLLTLPDETLVYPGHDYKGDTVSTIAEERAFNPRLQVSSVDKYIDLMNNLGLPNPKMMDVAVPANQVIGLQQQDGEFDQWSLTAEEAASEIKASGTLLVDLREDGERGKNGVIPKSVQIPYGSLEKNLRAGGMLHYEANADKRIIFYCAYGERSALAVALAREQGYSDIFHIVGGINAWKQMGGDVETVQ